MKCVECGAEIERLFEHKSKTFQFSSSDSNNSKSGKNPEKMVVKTEQKMDTIFLTNCDKCGKIGDKYCEDQFVVVFLDLILHKRQAFRHVLYNRFAEEQKPISFDIQ